MNNEPVAWKVGDRVFNRLSLAEVHSDIVVECIIPLYTHPMRELSERKMNVTEEYQGMDLRDYFAAKAMQGILSNQPTYSREIAIDGDTLAQSAYQIADAMMKAREK